MINTLIKLLREVFFCFLFASPDETYLDIEQHFSETVPEFHTHPDYEDQQILNPQKPGPSNDKRKYEKDFSIEPNPDLYLSIQKR